MSKTLGIILIVLGLFGLAYGGFSYTTSEKIVDIGPIHASSRQNTQHTAGAHWGRTGSNWRYCAPGSGQKSKRLTAATALLPVHAKPQGRKGIP